MEIKVMAPRVLAGSRCWNHPNRKVGDAKDTVGNARRSGRMARQLAAVVNAEGAKVENLSKFSAACGRQGFNPSLPFSTGPKARDARRKLWRKEGIKVIR